MQPLNVFTHKFRKYKQFEFWHIYNQNHNVDHITQVRNAKDQYFYPKLIFGKFLRPNGNE